VSSKTATRIAILRELSRNQLQELCRQLGLIDDAAAKAVLVERLVAAKIRAAVGRYTRRQRANQSGVNADDSPARVTKSNIKFETLAEAVPQIVWITDADGRNIYFNKQWVDYTWLTLEESYGHGWNIPFHPDDRLRAWKAWQHAVRTDGVYSLECRLRRADGTYRWWLIRGTALHDEKGRVVNWYGTWTDVEDIKQTEEALKRARDDAEAANRKLQQAYDEIRTLYEKTKALNQLVLPGIAWVFNAQLRATGRGRDHRSGSRSRS
jgi:PAS domain S-box-containing protein